ncbi:MAG TPA: diacylglycerol kinase family protein [Candidatus Saccharimonadales bacterium]|nr:diacylglycerol kinase family protein [Candidatus Saccharimonadales bacterium]
MYYYVLESPSTRGVRQNYQRLRDILTHLGIAGEIVTSSPARTPAEQAYIGTTKGYSTIVAVGGDAHINEVAMATIGRAVLGIIPIDASRQVTELIGASDMKSAAEALKHRRISLQDTVLIDPDLPLFLNAAIQTSKLAKVSLVIDNKVRAHAYFNELVVTRSLEVKIRSTYVAEKRKILGLFSVGGEQIASESSFHGKQIKIITDPPMPLMVGENKMADSPLTLRLVPESLKVITKRGTVLE